MTTVRLAMMSGKDTYQRTCIHAPSVLLARHDPELDETSGTIKSHDARGHAPHYDSYNSLYASTLLLYVFWGGRTK